MIKTALKLLVKVKEALLRLHYPPMAANIRPSAVPVV